MSVPLHDVLQRSQALGFLGPGPVDEHIAHAQRFLEPLGVVASGHVLDLGSGGGLPGLVLAMLLPATRWTLLDANERRTTFLREAVDGLGLPGRVEVVRARAEEEARSRRGAFDAVVARSFGRPAVTAECGAPFLRVGGRLIVSEPPDRTHDRWPTDSVALLGLQLAHAGDVAVLELVTPTPDRYPRSARALASRPLW